MGPGKSRPVVARLASQVAASRSSLLSVAAASDACPRPGNVRLPLKREGYHRSPSSLRVPLFSKLAESYQGPAQAKSGPVPVHG